MQGNVFGTIGRALIATLAIATGGTILVAATGGLPATVEARSADRGAARRTTPGWTDFAASNGSCSTRQTRRAVSHWCTS